jgi:hypothetical protein
MAELISERVSGAKKVIGGLQFYRSTVRLAGKAAEVLPTAPSSSFLSCIVAGGMLIYVKVNSKTSSL